LTARVTAIYLAPLSRAPGGVYDAPGATITREARSRERRTGDPLSVLSCTAWGFSCPVVCTPGGELLPRLFTLAAAASRETAGRFNFSVTLSVAIDLHRKRPRVLRGMLPCGVRTFLWRISRQRPSAILPMNVQAAAAV